MTRIKFLILILLLPLLLFPADPAKAAALAPEKQLPKASAKIVGQVAPEKKKPANGKEKLAVLDLERSGEGIDIDLAYSMSVVLRDALHSYGQYEVLSKEDLMALAKRLALQQGAGDECADDQCLVSYGRSLGTRYMVAGVLSKVGNTYSVSVRMLDTEGEEAGVVSRASERCKCSQDDLFGTVESVAAKLLGKAPQVAAVVAPKIQSPRVESKQQNASTSEKGKMTFSGNLTAFDLQGTWVAVWDNNNEISINATGQNTFSGRYTNINNDSIFQGMIDGNSTTVRQLYSNGRLYGTYTFDNTTPVLLTGTLVDYATTYNNVVWRKK